MGIPDEDDSASTSRLEVRYNVTRLVGILLLMNPHASFHYAILYRDKDGSLKARQSASHDILAACSLWVAPKIPRSIHNYVID
jgi:hypothetical protein